MAPEGSAWELVAAQDQLARWVAKDHPSDELEAKTRAWVGRMHTQLPTGIRLNHDLRHPKLGEAFDGVIFELDDRQFTVRITYWVNSKTRHITCGPIRSVRIPVIDPGDREDST